MITDGADGSESLVRILGLKVGNMVADLSYEAK